MFIQTANRPLSRQPFLQKNQSMVDVWIHKNVRSTPSLMDNKYATHWRELCHHGEWESKGHATHSGKLQRTNKYKKRMDFIRKMPTFYEWKMTNAPHALIWLDAFNCSAVVNCMLWKDYQWLDKVYSKWEGGQLSAHSFICSFIPSFVRCCFPEGMAGP